jgi:hypothetical protein
MLILLFTGEVLLVFSAQWIKALDLSFAYIVPFFLPYPCIIQYCFIHFSSLILILTLTSLFVLFQLCSQLISAYSLQTMLFKIFLLFCRSALVSVPPTCWF